MNSRPRIYNSMIESNAIGNSKNISGLNIGHQSQQVQFLVGLAKNIAMKTEGIS